MPEAGAQTGSLTVSTTALGTTVITLAGQRNGCRAQWDSTVSFETGKISVATTANRTICGIPPYQNYSMSVDVGVLPAATYAVEWRWLTEDPLFASTTFTVAPPTQAFVSPICPYAGCFSVAPGLPNVLTPVTLTFTIFDGAYPTCAFPARGSIDVKGRTITIDARYAASATCTSPDRSVHTVQVSLPHLDVGDYDAVLTFAADETYVDPPPVNTAAGPLHSGIAIVGHFTVADTAERRIVEYYYPPYDHYFITGDPTEVALLDAREPPFEGWERTGYGFNAFNPGTFPSMPGMAVCRFYNDSFAPKSSHFYAAHGLGCETTLAKFPDWKLETTDAFEIVSPVCTGQPVARYYNNGQGGAPNHRFVTSAVQAKAMAARGWISEGVVPEQPGVAFCAAADR